MKNEQKVAVITGASQGIGAALVKAYRDRNYRVIATARSIKPTNDDEVIAVPGDIGVNSTFDSSVLISLLSSPCSSAPCSTVAGTTPYSTVARRQFACCLQPYRPVG